MELRQMHYFLALIEERQFTRAAALCGVSQSGLSAAIRALEEDLGTRLFERNTRYVEATPAGRALTGHARLLVAAEAAAREAVADVSKLVAGPLRVGTEQCLGGVEVAPLLERIHRAHPGVDIEFLQEGSHELMSMLRAGRLDVAFVADGADVAGVTQRLLGSRPSVLLVESGHELARTDQIRWSDLAGLPFVDLQTSWAMRTRNDAMCAEHGVKREVRFVVNDVHALLDLVQRGLGAAIVPEHVAEKPQAMGLRAVRMPSDAPLWTVSVASQLSVPPAANVLLGMLPGGELGSPVRQPLEHGQNTP
jgi:DNA-binding transcriptional LysR family regulator